ncbi:hypothetical protein [Thiobacillus denitrificans]|uniref:hypothetical protein n=1 Tax=Thiobacillus denitrificans TaxID=36861 RepID=UPI0002FD1FE2|nr:hypothetical protein [Thiobacillus denitrificans]
MHDKGFRFLAAPTNAAVAAAFGKVATVPTSFIVGHEGRIRHKIAGQVHYPGLEKRIVPPRQSRAAEEPR